METQIKVINNADSRTCITLENPTGVNEWELDEQFCDGLLLKLSYVNMPSNFLAPKVGRIGGTGFNFSLPWAMLSFNDGVFWNINNYPKQPEDFPLRREGAVDLTESSIHLFNCVEDVLDVLRTLKDALGKATPRGPKNH